MPAEDKYIIYGVFHRVEITRHGVKVFDFRTGKTTVYQRMKGSNEEV